MFRYVTAPAVAILTLLVVTGIWNRFAEGNKPFALGELPTWYIHDAARFAGREGFPTRAFVANIGQAAVYSYHNGPDRTVFMDGRLEVCTRRTFDLYERILDAMAAGDRSWEKLLKDKNGGLPVVLPTSTTP